MCIQNLNLSDAFPAPVEATPGAPPPPTPMVNTRWECGQILPLLFLYYFRGGDIVNIPWAAADQLSQETEYCDCDIPNWEQNHSFEKVFKNYTNLFILQNVTKFLNRCLLVQTK